MVSDRTLFPITSPERLFPVVRVSLVPSNRSLQWLKMGQVRLMHAEHVKQWLQREHLSQLIPLSENSIKYSLKILMRAVQTMKPVHKIQLILINARMEK